MRTNKEPVSRSPIGSLESLIGMERLDYELLTHEQKLEHLIIVHELIKKLVILALEKENYQIGTLVFIEMAMNRLFKNYSAFSKTGNPGIDDFIEELKTESNAMLVDFKQHIQMTLI